MGMLKKAENRMAYGKVGLYGDAGSGKTVTAALLAIGIHRYAKLTKPVAMFDTEPGASFIKPLFDAAGIQFLVYDESRALKDLLAFMDEAEQDCSIAIMDSITHTWRDVQVSFLRKINAGRKERSQKPIAKLEFHHWGPIKEEWGRYTNRFLHSKLHCIVCGRAGSIYEYQENDQGKKELITTGTKMATEKEMGYEPSLLIEMMKRHDVGRIVNVAMVEKDRSMNYNGLEIPLPDKTLKAWRSKPEEMPYPFTRLVKHFETLNIGGEHFGSMQERDSTELFDHDGNDGWTAEQRQRAIWSEEVQGLLLKHLPGQTANEKKQKADLIEQFFNTRSWTKVESTQSDKLRVGYEALKAFMEAKPEPGQSAGDKLDAEQESGLDALVQAIPADALGTQA